MPKAASGDRSFSCTFDNCTRSYAQAKGLRRHERDDHGVAATGNSACIACDFMWDQLEEYRVHCQKEHCTDNCKFAKHQFTFADEAGFERWKLETEQFTRSSFALKNTYKNKDTGEVITRYYRCSCSGKPKAYSGERKRSTTSIKAGGNCPAYITVKFTATKQLKAECCLDHLGHEQKLGHLRIPEETRRAIAAALDDRVPIKEILRRIRAKVDHGFGREHIIDRKDIHNIKRQFSIDPSRKDDNDYISVKVTPPTPRSMRKLYSSILSIHYVHRCGLAN